MTTTITVAGAVTGTDALIRLIAAAVSAREAGGTVLSGFPDLTSPEHESRMRYR